MVLTARFPRRLNAVAVLRNAFRYLVGSAGRNWLRNLGSTAPALGSITLLLLLSGLVGLVGVAMSNLAQAEARDASLLHVYLRDDAKPAQVQSLRLSLSENSMVRSVTYVSKAQALARAQRRPGLNTLIKSSGSNPFPASLDVQVTDVGQVGRIDATVRQSPLVDPVFPTSYDKNAYSRIQKLMIGVAVAGVAFLALLGFIAITVTANSIRAAIHARRDEVSIMQLVGAPRWMVRGPFVIEGAMTGGLAGAVAGLITVALSLAAIQAGAGAFAQVAPGMTVRLAVVAALGLFVAGLLLGSGSSLISLRRHLET
ncbi:MAG: cell division protein FtsX [Candidatus Dormibacteraceae bacterium]